MENLLYDNILFKDHDYLDVYLDNFDNSNLLINNSFKHTCGKISSLLATSKTRGLGYQALNKLLDHTSFDELNDKLSIWTSLILKTPNECQLLQHSHLIWQILTKIAVRYANSEMCKEFTIQHLPKIYDLVKLTPSLGSIGPSLFCLYTCLKLFSCHHAASKEFLEDFLTDLLTTSNEQISLYSGKCLLLLQQNKNIKNNTAPKVQWLTYQRKLLASIHSIFNIMFVNVTENCDRYATQEQLMTSKLKISDEPMERYATLYYICRNLIQHLITCLRDPFPAKKAINVKQILNVINRGASVTWVQLQRNPIGENILLSLLLPKLHISLLNLLNTIILILSGHLKPYSAFILDILSSQLKWTSINANTQNNYQPIRKSILTLRIETYNTLSLWCETMNCGSRCDLIIENVIGEIFNDLTTEMNGLKLISMKRSNEQNDRTTKRIESKASTESLSIAALLCLQRILLTSANVIRPTTIRLIQTNIIQIGINMFDTFLKNSNDKRNGFKCRMEIYKTLQLVLVMSHHLGQPCVEIAVDILKSAIARERNTCVRNKCYSLLLDLEKIIHPTNSSLLFPNEVRGAYQNIFSLKEKQCLEDEIRVHKSNGTKSVEDTENKQHIQNRKELTVENHPKDQQDQSEADLHTADGDAAFRSVSADSNDEVLPEDVNEVTKVNNKTTSDEETDFVQPKRKKLLPEAHQTANDSTAAAAADPIAITTNTSKTAVATDASNKSVEEMVADLQSEFVYELNTI